MIVAHRGASQDAPENTIAAFNLAWEQGADAIEGDFQLTQDGQIVCIHDRDTKRVAGVEMSVPESTLSALRKLEVGSFHSGKYQGEKIPTLAEVLAVVGETKKIYMEIKCGPEIVPPLLVQMEQSCLRPDQMMILSLQAEVIRVLKKRTAQYKAFWLSGFHRDNGGRITPGRELVLQTLRDIRADGLSSSPDIPQELMAAVKGQGYEYHVWTVDDIATARRFQAWGADSITTNVPALLKTL